MNPVIALIVLVPAMITRGFVLSKLWLWFVVQLGVGGLSITHAIGITVVYGLLSAGHATSEHKDIWELVGAIFTYPFFLLFVGYTLTLIM